jgi:hypothetical protein
MNILEARSDAPALDKECRKINDWEALTEKRAMVKFGVRAS